MLGASAIIAVERMLAIKASRKVRTRDQCRGSAAAPIAPAR